MKWWKTTTTMKNKKRTKTVHIFDRSRLNEISSCGLKATKWLTIIPKHVPLIWTKNYIHCNCRFAIDSRECNIRRVIKPEDMNCKEKEKKKSNGSHVQLIDLDLIKKKLQITSIRFNHGYSIIFNHFLQTQRQFMIF